MKNKIFFAFLIFVSFFSTFSLQASFSREEQEELHDVNHSNIRTILEKYMRENAEILNSSKDKDIVAFIGKTGSGKSTLINYLSNKELRVSSTGALVLSNPSDPTTMKIGVGFESETFLPQYVNNQNLMFYDLPGIGETRGTAISLVNACFIKSIIEKARTTRLIFVIGQDEMTAERGRSFKDLSAIINNLIPNEIMENFSSLVITKSTPGLDNQRLINRLTEVTEPGVLTPWTQVGRLTHMSAPLGDQINQDDKENILQIIRNTPSKKINNINIGVIYNHQEQNKIRDIYITEIENNFNTLVNNNIDINLISALDIATLDHKKSYFQNNFFNDLDSLLHRSPLITLLRPFSEDTYTSCWNEVRGQKQIRVQNILQQIETRKADQLRIQAENARKVEEQRRIQAEQARQAEEQRRIQAENAQRAAEQKRTQIEGENRKLQRQLEDSKKLEQERSSILKEIPKLDALEQAYKQHIVYLAWHEKAILTSATYIAPEDGKTYRHSRMIAGNKKYIEENRAEYNRIYKEAERLAVLDIQEKKRKEIPTLTKKLDILESMYYMT